MLGASLGGMVAQELAVTTPSESKVWSWPARHQGCRLVIFPGLGHLLFWEDPDAFAAAVASFLLAESPYRTGPSGLVTAGATLLDRKVGEEP